MAVRLTKTLINQYRDSLESRECRLQTINMYVCYLNKLYDFLPERKELTEDNLKQWVENLKEDGYSDRTINLYLSSANGILKFCGLKKVPVPVISDPESADLPELTKEEYLKLLSYVRQHGTRRDYLLIRTLAMVDIEVVDFQLLTVEACHNGFIKGKNSKTILIPEGLRQELVSYIREQGLTMGPVFLSGLGNPLDRSNITHMINRRGRQAGLDPAKCNPRSLHKLCHRLQREPANNVMYMQTYGDVSDENQDEFRSAV